MILICYFLPFASLSSVRSTLKDLFTVVLCAPSLFHTLLFIKMFVAPALTVFFLFVLVAFVSGLTCVK